MGLYGSLPPIKMPEDRALDEFKKKIADIDWMTLVFLKEELEDDVEHYRTKINDCKDLLIRVGYEESMRKSSEKLAEIYKEATHRFKD